jgi:hypothetical protein
MALPARPADWRARQKKTREKEKMDSYDVRFWDTKRISDTGTGGRCRVRWAVDAREHCKSFRSRTLADGFLSTLKDAARDHGPFDPRTGLPAAATAGPGMVTWYAHARAYAEAKWAGLAPVSRRSVAEALVTVTIALTATERGAPEAAVLGRALFAWTFNPATRKTEQPADIAAALDWAARASLPVSALDDPATVRLALGACARTLDGKPAAGTTQRRKRSVFYNALGYAVEQGHLASNPVDRIQWTTPAVAATVDRRVVVSPAQARVLLAAVRGLSDRGRHWRRSSPACTTRRFARRRARATCTCPPGAAVWQRRQRHHCAGGPEFLLGQLGGVQVPYLYLPAALAGGGEFAVWQRRAQPGVGEE